MDHRRKDPPLSSPAEQSATFPDAARPHLHVPGSALVSVETRAGVLALRDAVPADLDAYLNYWHYSGERIKEILGIDQAKLGTPADTRERFLSMIRKPGTYPSDVLFTATLNGSVIGYTNMNRYGADEAYVHLHLYRRSLRSVLVARTPGAPARAGAGLAAALIGPGLSMYFRLFPLERLILQTRPENSAINKALDLYAFAAERRYVAHPAGLAAPGEQCLRYVHRADVPRMLRRSQALSALVAGAGSPVPGGPRQRADHGDNRNDTLQ